jgi:hypothetical protein
MAPDLVALRDAPAPEPFPYGPLVLALEHAAVFLALRGQTAPVTVVDLGCGVGTGAMYVDQPPVTAYVGVDMCTAALKRGEVRPGVTWMHGNITCPTLATRVPDTERLVLGMHLTGDLRRQCHRDKETFNKFADTVFALLTGRSASFAVLVHEDDGRLVPALLERHLSVVECSLHEFAQWLGLHTSQRTAAQRARFSELLAPVLDASGLPTVIPRPVGWPPESPWTVCSTLRVLWVSNLQAVDTGLGWPTTPRRWG